MNKLFNILAGAGSIFDFFPREPDDAQPIKSDAEQLAEDWLNVGNDLRWAMGQEELEHKATRESASSPPLSYREVPEIECKG